jgi:Iap family predicted aminopeptidase
MNIFKYPIFIACLVLVGSLVGTGQIAYSSKEDLEEAVKKVPCPQNQRLEGVRQLFKDAGATNDEIQIEKFDKDKISNVVVRKKGTTDETIVIGAHYDRTGMGCGAMDNWTGVAVVAHIYKTLRPLVTKKSYVFVGFDREEEGLLGSRQMAKAMEKTAIDQTCAMVNFDSFGMAGPFALRNVSSTKLIGLAVDLAKRSNFDFVGVDIEGATADSASFRDRKIPSITLSGLGANWTQILHTPDDKVSKINMDSVYMGYRFGVVYLANLDAAGCRDYR